jgi:hypothetical protein
MKEIDLTIPKGVYKVPVVDTRNGVDYMGPDIKINANDRWDAIERVKKLGYKPNQYFPPEEINERKY